MLPLYSMSQMLHGGDSTRGKEFHQKIVSLEGLGHYQEALETGRQWLAWATRMHDSTGIGAACISIGSEYQYLGETQLAIQQYLKASEVFENTRDKKSYLRTLNNIASIFIDLGEYAKAYSYAARSVAFARALKDTFEIAEGLINQGICERNENRTDTAIRHLEEVIELGKYLNNYIFVLEGRYDLGIAYDRLNTPNKAIRQYLSGLPIARQHDNPHYEFYLLDGLSDCYRELGQWAKAKACIREAIQIAERVKARRELSILYGSAATISQQLGELRKALFYKDSAQHLKDSLLNEETRKDIHELEIKYQTAQKDKELANQDLLLIRTQTAMHNRNILLSLSCAGIGLLLILIFLIYRFYRQRQRLNRQTIFSLQQEREVIRLKARMEGQDQERQRIAMEIHDDIGAGLTAISFLTDQLRVRDSERQREVGGRIADTANALVSKMKEIVWAMNKHHDNLDDLITYLRFNTAELLESAGMAYEFSVPDEIPAVAISGEQRRNIYLVVKEGLHNVVKHARASFVIVGVALRDDLLLITIRDNGRGIDEAAKMRFGNGLNNMRQRMANIGGGFSLSCGEGTEVTLSLRLNL